MEVHIVSGEFSWDHVHVRKLTGRESISRPFSFELDVVCDPEQGLPKGIVPGTELSLVFIVDGEEVRRIHGILGPIHDYLDPSSDRATYRLRVLPRVFRLNLFETQEIYMDLTVPQIIERKLDLHGFGPQDFEFRLLKEYPVREFVVQYRESDLAFISRLVEHLGVSFFFDHDSGSDKIVFTDHPSGFQPVRDAEEIAFRPRGEASDVFALEVTTDLVPTAYVVQDYNYRMPMLDLTGHHTLPEGSGGGVIEYGNHVKTPKEAQEIARVRAEERLSRYRVYSGKSTRAALTAGHRSIVKEHPRLDGPEDLLFVEVEHSATLPVFGESGDGVSAYANAFRAVPGSIAFRPPRTTPTPRIFGVVTGIVQPGAGAEPGGFARLDGEGRYTVQFHFDTALPGEQKASHPVRMAQAFNGPNHGMHFPLRAGAEVLLAFADGDPDRPIIVGSVPNAIAPSPVTAATADRSRISSATGVLFEFRDHR